MEKEVKLGEVENWITISSIHDQRQEHREQEAAIVHPDPTTPPLAVSAEKPDKDLHEDWFTQSFNPIIGCTKYSDGCLNCYAEREAKNCHRRDPKGKYKDLFKFKMFPELLTQKRYFRPDDSIFICSMSDLFQDEVPDTFIADVFNYIVKHDKYHFQICTKRAERLAEMASALPWPKNLWAGVTVESNKYVHRADLLRSVNPALRFIFAEPMVGSLSDLDLTGIGVVILGGESGNKDNLHKLRILKREWVIEMRDKCTSAGVPFFFKHWGQAPGNPYASKKTKGGCLLDGKVYHERPPLWPEPAADNINDYSLFC